MHSTSMSMSDSAAGAGMRYATWPAWQRFKLLYLSDDGRVIDSEVTSSTSQSYALFFALVGNDRPAFDAILRWTHDHLAVGGLDKSLPARQWGRDADGRSRILDSNPATAADLWIAYSLGEAARLWNEARYASLGGLIAANILRHQVATVSGLGAVLLPGPEGCVSDDHWRLNPGDLSIPLLRGLARHTHETAWNDIAKSSEEVILASAPKGFVADWIEVTRNGFVALNGSHRIGSFHAIRAYLWAGMLPASDPARDRIAKQLEPMLDNVAERGIPVETVDIETLEAHGEGPPGFSAALLPMLANARKTAALQAQRLRAADASLQNNHSCLSDALTLFGLGWLEQRYRFNRAGLLNVRWTPARHRHH